MEKDAPNFIIFYGHDRHLAHMHTVQIMPKMLDIILNFIIDDF